MTSTNTPVIIGVGDIKNRSTAIADAKEPATLMLEAIQKAISDTASLSKTDLQSAIDSIDVVKTWTWPYPDLPGLLAEKLGVDQSLKWKRYSEHGGDKPGKLFDEAAKRIAKGECKVAIVTGGEALASCTYRMPFRRLHSSLTVPVSACAAAKKLERMSICRATRRECRETLDRTTNLATVISMHCLTSEKRELTVTFAQSRTIRLYERLHISQCFYIIHRQLWYLASWKRIMKDTVSRASTRVALQIRCRTPSYVTHFLAPWRALCQSQPAESYRQLLDRCFMLVLKLDGDCTFGARAYMSAV